MNQSVCGYPGDRDQALVTFLYDDDPLAAADRLAFETHLATCVACRDEIDALGGVRSQLARWSPPEPQFLNDQRARSRQLSLVPPSSVPPSSDSSATTPARRGWWREIPAWAQVAAALLFLGVSARIANLDVRYDQQGLSLRTGWSQPRDARAAAIAPGVVAQTASRSGDAPWKADLTSLEQQLKAEMRLVRAGPATEQAQPVAAHGGDADLVRRVRALVDESEKRQQRELALRIAELLRDVNSQRQNDLVKVNRALGAVENNLGVEVLKTRQQVNLMYRASQVVR